MIVLDVRVGGVESLAMYVCVLHLICIFDSLYMFLS